MREGEPSRKVFEMAVKFKVYYSDGSTFEGDPFLAPAWGALLVVERDGDHGRRIVSHNDYFVWRDTRWWACDFIGLIDYLSWPGPKKVMFGRHIENEAWNAVFRKANEDRDFPVRLAYGAYEPKER